MHTLDKKIMNPHSFIFFYKKIYGGYILFFLKLQ